MGSVIAPVPGERSLIVCTDFRHVFFFYLFGTEKQQQQNKTNFNLLGSHEGGRLGGGTGKIARAERRARWPTALAWHAPPQAFDRECSHYHRGSKTRGSWNINLFGTLPRSQGQVRDNGDRGIHIIQERRMKKSRGTRDLTEALHVAKQVLRREGLAPFRTVFRVNNSLRD